MPDSALSIDPVRALIDDMESWQRSEHMTDKEMAEKIGVPRSTWMAARNKQFLPSLRFVQKVALVPEFRQKAKAVLVPPGPDGRR